MLKKTTISKDLNKSQNIFVVYYSKHKDIHTKDVQKMNAHNVSENKETQANSKAKNILILPGSKWQIPLTRRAKEKGLRVTVASPENSSPCSEYADEYFRTDIFDIDKILKYATKTKIDAVISDECDIAMPVVATLGEKLGLPALSSNTATLFTNKFLMREFCRKHNFNCPEYKLCHSEAEAIEFFKDLNAPMIIKPIDSNSSHGVFTVKNVEDIKKHFSESLSFSHAEAGVVAERFIEGVEFTVDGIKTPSKHYTLAISEKKHFSHNENIANTLYFTHTNEKFDYAALSRLNNAIIENSSLSFGLTHAEYKFENGKFYLIEMGARGGGNLISSVIVPFMSGVSTHDYIISCALGNILDKDFTIKSEYLKRASVLKFFSAPKSGGKVTKIKGLDVLENEPDIARYGLNFSVGDVVKDAESDSSRIGFYIACSESKEKLDACMKKIEESFKIETDNEEIERKISDYIIRNRVSTTETADALGKDSEFIIDAMPLNRGYHRCGKIKWIYAYDNSNWPIHEQIENIEEDMVIFAETFDDNNRAIFGELVSKYLMLYKRSAAIITNGLLRDAAALYRENWPIWCKGVTPLGCYNKKPKGEIAEEIRHAHSKKYDGALAVCDDCGVVIIPKEKLTEDFLKDLQKIESQEDIWFDRLNHYKENTFDIVCKKNYLKDDAYMQGRKLI